MTTNGPAEGADILSMLDSLEEAIEAEVSWSDLPPPPMANDAESSTVHEIRRDDPSRAGDARAAFAGISAALRRHPDPPPRLAGIGKRTYAKTRDVLASFKWGGG